MFSISIIAVSGCTLRTVKVIERNDKDSRKRVLVATQQSRFKEAVVSRVVEILEKDACYIKVIALKDLGSESTENYEAIIVVNTCRAWRLNGHARKFLKNVQEKGKIILVTTAKNENWRPKAVAVDAITSASEMTKVDAIAETIIHKVRTFRAKETGS